MCKKSSLTVLVILISISCFQITSLAQLTSGIPVNTAEKFNERGYSTSASSIFDNNEIIGDYDGNLSLRFARSVDLPNEMGYNTTVTYNANLSHKFFWSHISSQKSGYGINRPGWIIGIKDFAVQTTNFEVNFYIPDVNTLHIGESIPTLIPGYHYTNRSIPFENSHNEGFPSNDFIEILKADGSVLSLYNEMGQTNTGYYVETNSDGYGYAIVQLSPENSYLRRMYYKPGDGLTYYFEEETVKYSDRDSNASNFLNPKIMYLKEITSSAGDTLKVIYWDWSEYPLNVYFTNGYGRKLFKSIEYNRRVKNGLPEQQWFTVTSMQYNWVDLMGVIDIMDVRIVNLYNRIQLLFAPNTGSPIFSTHRGGGNSSSKIKYINGIIDELGRFSRINYGIHYRKYLNGSQQAPVFRFETPAYLPSMITYYNGKKSKFTYRTPSPTFEFYNFAFTSPGGCNSVNYSNIDVLNATFRDDFTNYMLQQRELFDSYPTEHLVLQESYDYIWGNGTNGFTMCNNANEIKTTITKTSYSNDNSVPNTVSITKNFSKYLVSYKPDNLAFEDYGAGVIRLKSEITKIDDNRKIEKINTWDENHMYGKMYWLLSTQENYSENGSTASKMTTFSYESIDALVPFKKVLTKKIVTDPYLLKAESVFNLDFIPQSSSMDISAFYKIGLPSYEKVYTGSDIKSFDTYSYFSSGANRGKLHTTTNNANSRSSTVLNDYYTISEDSSYYGLLKSQIFSNGILGRYYYPRFRPYIWEVVKYLVVADTIQAHLITNDGLRTPKNFIAKHYSTKPFKTELIYNNNLDTIRSWTSYNSEGNLLFEVDVNNIYSEYNYDIGGRITKAKFPGSFLPDGTIQSDTTYILKNINEFATRQFAIGGNNNSIVPTFYFTRFVSGGGTVQHYTEGTKIEDDAEFDGGLILPDGDDGGGGGGGGGTTPINQNYDFYIFFKDTISLKNIQNINFANLTIKTNNQQIYPTSNQNITLHGITQKWVNGQNVYEATGQQTVTFQPYSLITFDVSNILQSCINAGKNLYGFKFSAYYLTTDSVYRDFRFSFDTIPSFSASFKIFNEEVSNARSSVLFTYDDISNKMEMIKRFNHDPQNETQVHSLLEYDSFGQLRKSSVKNTVADFELKNENNYNYLGLKADEKDGADRRVFYKYDYFSRIDTLYFNSRSQSSPKQSFQYTPLNTADLFELKTIKDENNKETKIYYKKNGLVEKEEKYDGAGPLTTQYTYDVLQRLTEVTPPRGAAFKTIYQYDDHNNIKQKTSPDEGTIKYKYDKYGNLRFSLNTGASSSEKALMFTKYDQFNRPVLTGLITKTFFDLMYPDLDYSIDQIDVPHFENSNTDTTNFVVVNMYDKYFKTGVFTSMPNPHLTSFISDKNLKGKLVATAFRDKPGDQWNFKVYTYDYLGRVHYYWVKMGSENWKVIINEYDNIGNLAKQVVNNEFHVWYNYDEQGRLKEVRSNIHNAKTTSKLDAVYTYDKSDRILTAEFGSNVKPKMFYTYDIRGRLIDLNGLATDQFNTQFRETLTYFDNNNIQSMLIQNTGNGSWPNLTYNFVYDGLNRLKNSNCSNTAYSESFLYDTNGNFITKNRSGKNMSYYYNTNTNKINYVKFNTVNKYYTHDYRGNIVSDGNKGLSNINYDRRNLVLSFIKSGQTNYYRYDDNGNRIYKGIYNQPKEYYFRDHTGKELGVYDINTGRLKMLNLYGNGFIGRVDVNWIPDSICVEEIPGQPCTWEYYDWRKDDRFFYFKDHLGSIRMTLDENSEIVSAQDYYPYGEILRSYTTGADVNSKYKFTEKERDTETNYDYFGARYYDSELARWLSIDPLASKYPSWSPYNYVLNNPLIFFDPNGMDVYVDDKLKNTNLVDKDGKPIPIAKMTDEQKQIYYFQKWWEENGANVEKLFGKGGKYGSTDIYFKLGLSPRPKGDLRGEYYLNSYDALTTFGNKEMADNELFRGGKPVHITDGFNIDNLKIKIWQNPKQLLGNNPLYEEWNHVSIIFNSVQNQKTVPAAGFYNDGSEQNKATQHYMIKHNKVPIIK